MSEQKIDVVEHIKELMRFLPKGRGCSNCVNVRTEGVLNERMHFCCRNPDTKFRVEERSVCDKHSFRK